MARMRSGDNDGGLEALATVIRVAPDQGLAPGYPPPFKRAFDQAKRKVLGGGRTSVVIRGDGQVMLDGKEQGAAPTTVQNVLQGSHFLRVTRADGSAWGLKLIVGEGENTVTIPAGGEVRRTPVAAAAPAPAPTGPFAGIAANRLDDSLLAEVAAAGKAANAEYVVFGGLYQAGDGNVGLAAHLYSLRAHGAVALKPIAFDADLVSAGIEANKLATEVVQRLKALGPTESTPGQVAPVAVKVAVAETRPPPVVRPEETKKPIIKREPEEVEGSLKKDESKPKVASAEPEHETHAEVRTLEHKSTPEEAAGGLTSSTKHEPEKPGDDEGSSHILLYSIIGGTAAVLVGGGVGGYFIYKNRSTPVTGSASLTFQ
jgi:hypothetical protein